jgi:hypothetical protein
MGVQGVKDGIEPADVILFSVNMNENNQYCVEFFMHKGIILEVKRVEFASLKKIIIAL